MLEMPAPELAAISAACAAAAFLSLSARGAFRRLTPSGARSATRNSTIFVTTFSTDLTKGSQTSLMPKDESTGGLPTRLGDHRSRGSIGSSANDGEVRRQRFNRKASANPDRIHLTASVSGLPRLIR